MDKEIYNKILNIDTIDLATKLYNLSCDLDGADYDETKKDDIKDLEFCLSYLKTVFALDIIEKQINKDHFCKFLLCLDTIANNN